MLVLSLLCPSRVQFHASSVKISAQCLCRQPWYRTVSRALKVLNSYICAGSSVAASQLHCVAYVLFQEIYAMLRPVLALHLKIIQQLASAKAQERVEVF